MANTKSDEGLLPPGPADKGDLPPRRQGGGRQVIVFGVAFALVFPTVITWIYFSALREHPSFLQQSAYLVGKVIQFGFPLVWVAVWRLQRLSWLPRRPREFALGIAFGIVVAAAMLGLYFLALKPAGFFQGPDEKIREKVAGLGLTETWKYAALGIFYALAHSLLEEYYWRWFVFGQLRRLVATPWAIAVSSLGFMSHHVLLLATFFGWQSPATWLFAAAVGVGGAIWAWLYERSQSLLVPWIGHCLVDAAIFALGYDLAREIMH
jgi:membrane protease YdiL (CAAX protease family)